MYRNMRFSVAMCVYYKDEPAYVSRALESVLQNSVVPDEVVVVADGPISSDLEAVIRGFAQVRFLQLDRHYGHAHARNVSVRECHHPYVALMDADDICAPERFARQLERFAQDDVDVVGGYIDEFMHTPDNIVSRREVALTHAALLKKLKYTHPFNNMTVMFRRSAFDAAGGYDSAYFPEDWFLSIKMARHGCRFANIPYVCCLVRVTSMLERRGGMAYFRHVCHIYGYLYRHQMITWGEYCGYVAVRAFVQLLLRGKLRELVYTRLLRSRVSKAA